MYLLLLAEELEVWPPLNAYFRRSFLSIRGELLVAHPKENESSASSSIMSVDCRAVTRMLSPTVLSQYVKPWESGFPFLFGKKQNFCPVSLSVCFISEELLSSYSHLWMKKILKTMSAPTVPIKWILLTTLGKRSFSTGGGAFGTHACQGRKHPVSLTSGASLPKQ